MRDLQDRHHLGVMVDSVEHSVRAPSCTERAGQIPFQRFADPGGIQGEVAEDELDDRRNDARWNTLQIATCGGGDDDVVAQLWLLLIAPRHTEFRPELCFVEDASGSDIALSLGQRLADAGL